MYRIEISQENTYSGLAKITDPRVVYKADNSNYVGVPAIMEDEIGKRDKEFNKKRNLKGD